MMRIIITACILLICGQRVNEVSAQQQLLTEDVIYLKDGAVFRGTIISIMPNPRVKIVTREGNLFVCPMQDVEKITRESVRIRRTKNPTKALLLSLTAGVIADGSGQFYNGDMKKGAFFFGWSMVSDVMIWRGIEDNIKVGIRDERDGTLISDVRTEDIDGDDAFFYIGLISRVISYVAAAADAHQSARWKSAYVSAAPTSPQFGIRIVPTLTPQQKGLFVYASGAF